MRFDKEAIKTWAKAATAGQTKAFTYEAGRAIGHGVVRGTNQVHQMSKVAVVLKKVVDQNRIYFVLTSYPKRRSGVDVELVDGPPDPAAQLQHLGQGQAHAASAGAGGEVDGEGLIARLAVVL
jgi:hypothetical protein